MTREQLESILTVLQSKTEKDGYQTMPDGALLTIHAAHDGTGLNISRVEALRVENDIVYARTHKNETFAVVRDDIFAIALEASHGQPARRAGF